MKEQFPVPSVRKPRFIFTLQWPEPLLVKKSWTSLDNMSDGNPQDSYSTAAPTGLTLSVHNLSRVWTVMNKSNLGWRAECHGE